MKHALALVFILSSTAAVAQHNPYFVTYNHEMEEVGNLELNYINVVGSPRGGNSFWGSQAECELRATNWWTPSLYLDGQNTANESPVFTGDRLENRFKLL